jgi:dethiobiotin synthase
MIGPILIPILATGTNVGKTFVTAALARLLHPHAPCLALKPVESGWNEATSNAARIAAAAGRLQAPLSPHLAAEREGLELRAEALAAWVRARLLSHAASARLVFVETAGGVCTPLSPSEDNRDLVAALSPPRLVLVVADRLGALHDARAALIALRARCDTPVDVVFSAPEAPDHTTGANAAELTRLDHALRAVHTLPRDDASALGELARSLLDGSDRRS